MPRIKTTNAPETAEPVGWQQVVTNRIKKDKVVPLISNTISNELIFGQQNDLAEAYAQYIAYPLTDQPNLSQLAQFRLITDEDKIPDPLSLREDYVNFIKNKLFDLAQADGQDEDTLAEVEEEFDDLPFSEFARRLSYPSHTAKESDPLLILAAFPLSIYLTTSYHNLLEKALQQLGKNPRTEICPWHERLESLPSALTGDYQPTVQAPLVYHLHGYDQYPESLVLTEDDYLEFLVTVTQDRNRDRADPVSHWVRGALADRSVLLLGYSLRSWDFRAMFRGLIKQPRGVEQMGVCLQLEPNEVERKYLEKYLKREAKFEVYWGNIHSYLAELRRGLEA
jgi:hypothetical protein